MNPVIKLHPEIIFYAKRQEMPLGAFRLWFLARGFDNGCGFIPAKEFRQYLRSHGITKTTQYRWIDQAINLGLIKKMDSVYRLVSLEKCARIVGVTRLMRPVVMPMEKFIQSKKWLPWVWSGFLLHFKGKPITRGTLEKLSGVPASTQLEYEKIAQTEKTANYADICNPENNPELAINSFPNPGFYCKNGRIRRRLGNTYMPTGVQLGNKGRLKQVNEALCIEDSSQFQCFALYCQNDKELKKKTKALRKWGDPKNSPSYIYRHCADLPKGSVWLAVSY